MANTFLSEEIGRIQPFFGSNRRILSDVKLRMAGLPSDVSSFCQVG
jgi:hypothetical protein